MPPDQCTYKLPRKLVILHNGTKPHEFGLYGIQCIMDVAVEPVTKCVVLNKQTVF